MWIYKEFSIPVLGIGSVACLLWSFNEEIESLLYGTEIKKPIIEKEEVIEEEEDLDKYLNELKKD